MKTEFTVLICRILYKDIFASAVLVFFWGNLSTSSMAESMDQYRQYAPSTGSERTSNKVMIVMILVMLIMKRMMRMMRMSMMRMMRRRKIITMFVLLVMVGCRGWRETSRNAMDVGMLQHVTFQTAVWKINAK